MCDVQHPEGGLVLKAKTYLLLALAVGGFFVFGSFGEKKVEEADTAEEGKGCSFFDDPVGATTALITGDTCEVETEDTQTYTQVFAFDGTAYNLLGPSYDNPTEGQSNSAFVTFGSTQVLVRILDAENRVIYEAEHQRGPVGSLHVTFQDFPGQEVLVIVDQEVGTHTVVMNR